MAFTNNKRTFWAVEAIGTAPDGTAESTGTYNHVPGVQSVGVSVNFNLEQIFQLGQLEIYQDLEDIPDVELTVEKVIDDTCLMYVRCVDPGAFAGKKELTVIQDNKVDIMFEVHNTDNDNTGDANALQAAYMSGMFVSSVNFNFGTDGFFTESITLVGNHQKWFAPAATMASSPSAVGGIDAGDVARRQNFSFADIANVPEPVKTIGGNLDDLRISSISVSTDLGREEMFSLGERQAYHRFVTFPIEVTCDIEAYVTDVEDFAFNALPEADNVSSDQHIKFQVDDPAVTDILNAAIALHTFDLGEKNTLSSITWNGLSTDGTNATVTYSYRNFNKLDITSTATA